VEENSPHAHGLAQPRRDLLPTRLAVVLSPHRPRIPPPTTSTILPRGATRGGVDASNVQVTAPPAVAPERVPGEVCEPARGGGASRVDAPDEQVPLELAVWVGRGHDGGDVEVALLGPGRQVL